MLNTIIPRKPADGRIVERFTLTAQNILDKKVVLNANPKTDNGVILDFPCGSIQILGTDYELINDKEISWNGLGAETILAENDKIIIIYT